MKCPKCHSINDEKTSYCYKCGANLVQLTSSADIKSNTELTKLNSMAKVFAIISFVLVAFLIFSCSLTFLKLDKSSEYSTHKIYTNNEENYDLKDAEEISLLEFIEISNMWHSQKNKNLEEGKKIITNDDLTTLTFFVLGIFMLLLFQAFAAVRKKPKLILISTASVLLFCYLIDFICQISKNLYFENYIAGEAQSYVFWGCILQFLAGYIFKEIMDQREELVYALKRKGILSYDYRDFATCPHCQKDMYIKYEDRCDSCGYSYNRHAFIKLKFTLWFYGIFCFILTILFFDSSWVKVLEMQDYLRGGYEIDNIMSLIYLLLAGSTIGLGIAVSKRWGKTMHLYPVWCIAVCFAPVMHLFILSSELFSVYGDACTITAYVVAIFGVFETVHMFKNRGDLVEMFNT